MLVKQAAYVLGKIHQQEYLSLDIKPDNILVLDGYQKQLQLFDFDSLLAIQDLRKACEWNGSDVRLSYSKGFAPIELQRSKINRLGPCTDVYGIGVRWMQSMIFQKSNMSAANATRNFLAL